MTGAPYEPFPDVGARNDLQASLEVPLLVRALRPPSGGRVLEVGCGRGVALPVLERLLRPRELVGLDVDPLLLAEAGRRTRGTAARLVPGDLQALPFPDASFDLVVDFGTCYHVSDPARALAEVARVLAPGGRFVHETPVAQHLAHPVRSFGRRLPWATAPALVRERAALLWAMRRRASA